MVDLGLMGEDQAGSKLQDMLSSLTFETNFFKRLQALEVVFNMIEDDLGNKVGVSKFKKFLSEYTNSDKFMRQAKLISIIEDNIETALEYYGRDYISAPEFNYDKDFQSKRRKIDTEINKFIGQTLKKLATEEDFFD